MNNDNMNIKIFADGADREEMFRLYNTKIIKGLNQPLTLYRKRKNSLSSNIILSLINGYKVYRNTWR